LTGKIDGAKEKPLWKERQEEVPERKREKEERRERAAKASPSLQQRVQKGK
jgi:hypothetical protein